LKARRTRALCGTAVLAAAWLVVLADEPAESPAFDTAAAARRARERGGETYPFRWKLGGFLGVLAGLFVPRSGDALLSFVPAGDERVEVEMLITSPGRDGEYFRYGAEVDAASGDTRSVQSHSVFRGKTRSKDRTFTDGDVIDFASVFYRLRWYPPRTATEMRIWSDGKIYPVVIEPLPAERRSVGDEKIEVRGYAVLPVPVKGQASFDDKFSVWFALDERSTPVAIDGRRGWVKVRFQLQDSQDAG
jgi:hypothetical protein